ncbi:MAG: uracil-DNA glycosylase [Proteobacteria bacterium]|nr:MAG: uracil-DNA glycosylase [Pseudomonadota bacterium]
MALSQPIKAIESDITGCEKCPRLRGYCAEIARVKKRAYLNEDYWGRPVPGFGDPHARLLVLGLAPGAHGANRTGRMVTGDSSGVWLYRALFRAGFANQPESTRRDDGLKLQDAYVSCLVKCAPPENLPARDEFLQCAPYWQSELASLPHIQVIVALGKIAFDSVLKFYETKRIRFSHGVQVDLPTGVTLIASYHPSQQNTFTGLLKEPEFDQIFILAKSLIHVQ